MAGSTLPPSISAHDGGRDRGRVAGLVVVFTTGAPAARVMPLGSGALELGRDEPSAGKLNDGRVSRRHAIAKLEAGRCVVVDLGSQNGSHVDGVRIEAHVPTPVERVLRLGDSLLVPCADIRPFEHAGVRSVDGLVRGPAMQAVLEEVIRAARGGTTLHLHGESGTGKEGIARAFHRASARAAGAMIAVNCAAIPPGLSERLLFGVRRGAYSGAEADASGYIQEAHGGTLFLDEIAELDLAVQAKLLRVLESGEVLPLGASKPRKVEFALCSATHKDLRALVALGALREDLFFRVGRPAATLPPLRDRCEEIPPLIVAALDGLPDGPIAHVSLVEACLLRAWPGNIRELIAEIRIAAQAAHAAPDAGYRVFARHLAPSAGSMFGEAMPEATPRQAADANRAPDSPRKRTPHVDDQWRRRIEEALRIHAGNIAASARALGLHRTQLRRIVERHQIAVATSTDERDD